MLVYITATDHTVSAALVQDVSGTQHPVYFVSKMLQDPETRYQMVEKLALSLVHAARRLRPYFQNHSIIVKTDYPIQKILQKPDLAGQMSSWVVELSEFNIRYEPHGPIKAQCLLDFINDLQQTPTEDQWTLHVDGSLNPKGAGAGIVLEGPNDILIEKSPPLRLQNIQQPSRIQSHPRWPILGPRSWHQILNMQNRFQAHCGPSE